MFSGLGIPANNGQGDAPPDQHQPPPEQEGVQGDALAYQQHLDEIFQGLFYLLFYFPCLSLLIHILKFQLINLN